MTIEYKDSKRIVALSTDIADTATFEDDFSGADNWTDTGSGWGVNTTTDVIDFNADSPHNVTEGLYYDLGSALSSVFTIRFKLTIANFNVGSSSIENHLYFGVSDSTSHVRTQTQDIIGIHSTHWTGGNANWKTMTANNAALPGTRDYTFTHALQAETLYVQIKSLSSSQFQVDFYSDSGYSTLIESSGAQSHSATGLRYLKFQQRNNAPSGDDHTLNGTIDDVEVYDGATTSKPTNVQDNSLLVEKDTARRYWFNGTTWDRSIRGIFAGGGLTNVIQYITITTTGNATDFGDLTESMYDTAGCADDTRGIRGGGFTSNQVNTMDYITILTLGNATDFGDLTVSRNRLSSLSDSTRGIWAGGSDVGGYNTIDYVTIQTTGNAIDFGDLTGTREDPAGCADSTRGVIGGGSATSNVIDYITIQTTGNATDFGDLTVGRKSCGAVADTTRGVFAGGSDGSDVNTIDYITIQTTGNATDFGDLTIAKRSRTGVGDSTRGCFGGGQASDTNIIDYITIATTGNASDFGDLIAANRGMAGFSDYVK
jgi:hypothetical protein